MGNLHIFDAVKLLLKRFFLVVVIFSVSRLLFLIFNLRFFLPLNPGQILRSFLFGIRFDIAELYYMNFIFILLSLLPFRFTKKKVYQKILFFYFIIVNTVLLLFNFIDTGYFEYIHKRSGWELLDILFTGTDAAVLLPHYLKRYWYLILLWLASVYILYRLYPRPKYSEQKDNKFRLILQTFAGLIILFIGFGAARGLKSKPLRIISANQYVNSGYIPLLLNTPFVIINTMNHQEASEMKFYPPDICAGIFNPLHISTSQPHKFVHKNVVILILESFGKEYMVAKGKDGKSFTPFLDSLSHLGLNCTHAYANAFRSIDALPAILGGFPSMLNTTFISSAYSINKTRGLPEILKEEGYRTAFFHGGHNGTMGFDIFTKSVGIDHYYGFNEYNNDEDYDGAWGIWDEKFLQYMDREIDKFRQPFFAAVFTLSSHDPYSIPKKFADRFHPGENPVLRAVEYTDFSLKEFFKKAAHSKWFSNTLFVICPDHTSKPLSNPYKTMYGRVSIPLIFYAPGDSSLTGQYNMVTQQLDIMPSVLDYLGYRKKYVAFGKSIFASGYRFSVSDEVSAFQTIDSSYCITFDGEKILKILKIQNPTDPLNSLKPVSDSACKHLKNVTKAYLQDYYWRMTQNHLADTVSMNKTISE